MRRTAVAIFLAVFAFGAIAYWGPWWSDERPVITANPTLYSLGERSLVTVPAGGRACIDPVPFGPAAERVQVIVNVAQRPRDTPPLRVEARAPGYSATGRLPAYPAKVDDARLEAAIPPAPRDVEGTLCLVPEGDRPVRLVGTKEGNGQTRAVTTVDGRDLGEEDITVTLLEARPRPVSDHFGSMLRRMSGLTDGLAPVWLLWPLALLVALGLPVLAAVAYVRSLPQR
jgi:hypothetical protein